MDHGRMRPVDAAAPLLMLLTGCYDDSAYKDLLALDASRASDASTSDSEVTGPGGVTITGGTEGTSGSATAAGTSGGDTNDTDAGGEAEGDVDPQLHLQVDPPLLHVAGPLTFAVDHSADVERLALFEGDDDEPTLEWLAGEEPPTLLVTRGAFSEVRTFVVRGYDADDHFGTSNPATVQLLLPPPGTLLWEKTFDIGADGAGRAATSGAIFDEPSIIVGFDENKGARVGRYTPEGAPQVIAAPTAAPTSTLNGVALDSAGKILAVGGDTIDGVKRPWLVRVDPHTAAAVPIFTGKAGEVATGCAFDPKSGRIYVSGYSPDQVLAKPDARIWAFSQAGALLWTRTWERPVELPAEVGKPVDLGFAVAVLANGDPVLVGESQYQPPDVNAPLEVWAFAHRYDPNGALDGTKSWTSDNALDTAGARAVTPDRDNGLLVAGWSSVAIEAPRQATVFAFGALLKEADLYTAEAVGRRVAEGVARLPTGELVVAMDVDDKDQAAYYAEIRGVDGDFGPPAWSHVFDGEAAIGRVGELSLTVNGHILVVGTRMNAGTNTMFLAALHP